MGKVEQITVGLPAEDLAAVRRAVEAGEYASEAEALSAAVRAWREQQTALSLPDDEIGALWDEGIGSGAGRFQSFDARVAEAERSHAKQPGEK
jgi:antitoxin ParD1/3/4